MAYKFAYVIFFVYLCSRKLTLGRLSHTWEGISPLLGGSRFSHFNGRTLRGEGADIFYGVC